MKHYHSFTQSLVLWDILTCMKELNTLVVIDPQVLFDKITDLIIKTFTVENVGAK